MALQAYGELSAAQARQLDLYDEIQGLTGLSKREVRKKLDEAHGRTHLRNVFGERWPTPFGELCRMTATMALGLEREERLAEITGLSARQVRARLQKVRGNTLVPNVFTDRWPDRDPYLEAPASTTVQPTTKTGAAQPKTIAAGNGPLIGDRYAILRRLGAGGMGQAFEAVDQLTKSRVVLKYGVTPGEYQIAARLSHPNICRYHNLELDRARANEPFAVMEHGGRSVADVIAQNGPLQTPEAIRIVTEAARALDYAHEQKVIHSDVSPGNVLVATDGRVRLTDFGVSVQGQLRTVVHGQRTVVAGTVLGYNRAYVAPEVLAGERPRARSDQYSLALVFCSMMEGEGLPEDYRPRRFSRLKPTQNAALFRALAEYPSERFGSCGEFARTLGQV